MTEEMYEMLRSILSDRAAYWQGKDQGAWGAYESALAMIEYAHEGNYECLSQFDTYK